MVVVDEVDAGSLVRRAPHLAADVGHQDDADVFVLENDCLPRHWLAVWRRAVVAEIRIAPLGDRRNGVGIGERISLHFYNLLRHRHRAKRNTRDKRQTKHKRHAA